MEVEVHSGMVLYVKSGPLGKKKVKRFAVLYEHSNLGVQRLELYDSQDTFEKKEKWKKHAHVINLERCTNVVIDRFHEGKKLEFALITQFESDEKPQTFILDTEEEMTSWLQHIQALLFGKRELLVNEYTFEVEIKTNAMSKKMNLKGVYLLSVSMESVDLLDRQTRKSVVNWPLHLLRRYGRDKQEFTIEAGRRCTTGEGMFVFKTDHYNAIFRQVESNVKTHVARSRTNSNASVKGPPAKYQPPEPQPSPKKSPTPSSVYESPLDAKSPISDPSGVYSEPINLKPTSKKDKKSSSNQQNGQKGKKGFPAGLPPGPKKPPRKNPAPSVDDSTYSEPVALSRGENDLNAEYSHLNISGYQAPEAEYDSISYSQQWNNAAADEENTYATTSNPSAPPIEDDVYDRVLR